MLWWTMPLRTGTGPELPDGNVNVVRGTLATLLEHSNSYVYYYHEAAWSKRDVYLMTMIKLSSLDYQERES